MIVHIVMFAFKPEGKAENLQNVKKALEALPALIEPLEDMEVGVNFSDSERAFDLVLTSTFADKEGLKTYQVHPEHQKVVQLIKEVTIQSRVVDYVKA